MHDAFRIASVGLLMSITAAVSAQDFRVETDLFRDEIKEPIAETLTIFFGGRVYDFLLRGSEEITIFDPAHGRFTLLDPARKLQCTIANQELLALVQELNKAAIEQKSPLFAAAADPKFETSAEKLVEGQTEKTKVTLASKWITYAATGREADQPAAAEAFQQFADWYARLNAVRGGGSLPPGARLVLGRELVQRKMLPDEIVRVTVEPGRLGLREKKLTVRSRHLFNWTLSGADRKRIEQAGDHLANFQAVSFAEYISTSARPAALKTTKR